MGNRRHSWSWVWLLPTLACADPAAPPPEETLPPWLQDLIHQFEQEPVSLHSAWIARYDYKGNVVYYFPPHGMTEAFGLLRAAEGSFICAPDGGFSGSGDGRCPDFIAEKRNEKIVWRDLRLSP